MNTQVSPNKRRTRTRLSLKKQNSNPSGLDAANTGNLESADIVDNDMRIDANRVCDDLKGTTTAKHELGQHIQKHLYIHTTPTHVHNKYTLVPLDGSMCVPPLHNATLRSTITPQKMQTKRKRASVGDTAVGTLPGKLETTRTSLLQKKQKEICVGDTNLKGVRTSIIGSASCRETAVSSIESQPLTDMTCVVDTHPNVTHTHAQTQINSSTQPIIPSSLARLRTLYHSLDLACAFLRIGGRSLTVKNVRGFVLGSCGLKLTHKDLYRICAIAPKLIRLNHNMVEQDDIYALKDISTPLTKTATNDVEAISLAKEGFFEDVDEANTGCDIDEPGLPPPPPVQQTHTVIQMLGKGSQSRKMPTPKALDSRRELFEVQIHKWLARFAHDCMGRENDEEVLFSTVIYGEAADDSDLSSEWVSSSDGQSDQGSLGDDPDSDTCIKFLSYLKKLPFYNNQIAHVQHIPGRKAVYSDITIDNDAHIGRSVTDAIKSVLKIKNLYTHQSEAIRHSIAGDNVIICTSTSSGKSLAYNIPVLQAIVDDPKAMALYLFPTKALAQDQQRALRKLTAHSTLRHRVKVSTYDGDTENEKRKEVRDSANIILSNPDMVHASLLPGHEQWSHFFSRLRYVVVDEAHIYRGQFGSHAAMVFRRLLRMCAHYGSSPQWIVCTATIANPQEHFRRLIPIDAVVNACEVADARSGNDVVARHDSNETDKHNGNINTKINTDINSHSYTQRQTHGTPKVRTLVVVDKDGSPNGQKDYVLWNPGVTASVYTECGVLLCELAKTGLRCISFCKVRAVCELVCKITQSMMKEGTSVTVRSGNRGHKPNMPIVSGAAREDVGGASVGVGATTSKVKTSSRDSFVLPQPRPDLVQYITTYRGGYTALDRRKIEKDLFSGSLLSVVATNALELGIDVGALDCVLQLGYPGSISSLWQQAGRAGRSGKRSLAILVCYNSPLDQHFINDPQSLFSKSPECAVLDPHNTRVLWWHLLCACTELPLCASERSIDSTLFGFKYTAIIQDMIDGVAADGSRNGEFGPVLHPANGGYYNITHAVERPHARVSLRNIYSQTYKVFDSATEVLLDTLEERRAHFELYDGAVYLHRGNSYVMEDVDHEHKIAYACKKDVNYHTQVRDQTLLVDYSAKKHTETSASLQCAYGTVRVVTSVFGFNRIMNKTHVVLETSDCEIPDYEFTTDSLWIDVGLPFKAGLATANLDYRGGLHACNHLIANVMGFYMLCDRGDVKTVCYNEFETVNRPLCINIYDTIEGGTGLSEAAFDRITPLVEKAYDIIKNCPCTSMKGCPCCTHDAGCSEYNKVLDKGAALWILERLAPSSGITLN